MMFGAAIWQTDSPRFYGNRGITWDVSLDPDEASLEDFRDFGK
jgi:hypothetical protein